MMHPHHKNASRYGFCKVQSVKSNHKGLYNLQTNLKEKLAFFNNNSLLQCYSPAYLSLSKTQKSAYFDFYTWKQSCSNTSFQLPELEKDYKKLMKINDAISKFSELWMLPQALLTAAGMIMQAFAGA